MDWAWIITIPLFSAYAILMLAFLAGWIRSTRRDAGTGKTSTGSASIVIPVRNEEGQIGSLLGDLINQDHPGGAFEIIVVNDHSTDNTVQVVNALVSGTADIRLAELGEGEYGKKAAIRKGVSLAKHEIVVSTDGDCRAPPGWLGKLVVPFGERDVRMVAGPVLLYPDNGLFRAMQSLEFLSLVGVSAAAGGLGSPIMCNAANLAYRKKDFSRFLEAGVTPTESGDDIFLMLWLKNRHPGSIRYIIDPGSAIHTTPSPGLSAFLMQRFRWVSKSRFYRDWLLNTTALLVYLTSISMLLLAILCFMAPRLLVLLLVLLLAKSLVDALFLNRVLKYYGKRKWLLLIMPLELVYFMYVSVVGMAGQFFPHTWKGRNIQP